MPLVKIDLHAGKGAEFHRKVSDAVHEAMVATINVPAADKFQIITKHAVGDLVFPPAYLDIPHDKDILFIQIFLNTGRTVEMKQALYQALAKGIQAAVDFDTKDLIINLVEVRKEDWSFGNGIAQYV
jgi:phenylpyruvate tautomerase PptA (4-oxalocrotonate tautomerase family)